MSTLADSGASPGASAGPASRSLGVTVSRPGGARPGNLMLGAGVGPSVLFCLLLLLASGCGADSSDPVAARSAEQGIALEDASVRFQDPPLAEKTCEANGTVRNRTPDRILTAIEVIAFSPDGGAVATAQAETFDREKNGRADPAGLARGTLQPGESGFFHELLSDLQGRPLHTCGGIARIELTEAIFE